MSRIDPGWVSRIRGVDELLLQRYLELAGRPKLPESFRQTALSMGLDAGGLFRDLRVDANLERVVSLYEDDLRSEPQAINHELPVVATYIVGDQISLDLRGGAEPAVVDTSSGELVGPRARSWEAFVMQAAILYGEPRRVPGARWHSSSPSSASTALAGAPAREILADFATQLELPLAWPSDDCQLVAVNVHSSLFAMMRPKNAVLLYAFSSDAGFLRRVDEELAPAIGASAGGVLRLVNGELRDSKRGSARR